MQSYLGRGVGILPIQGQMHVCISYPYPFLGKYNKILSFCIIQMNNIQVQYNEHLPPPHQLTINPNNTLPLRQLKGVKLATDIMSIKYDREGDYLALGGKNGSKLLYSTVQNKFVTKMDDLKENAVTSLKWRPSGEGKSKILVSADAGGFITFHHIPTLKPLFTISQPQNSIHTLDCSFTGKFFATGGKDFHIRLYDQDTKTLLTDLQPAGWNNIGHDNRVFAVKFIDQHTLISGGWDSVVHIWDLRQGKSIRHFYGANISGESLDYENGRILAGCYAAQNQIQVWDIKTLKKVEQIDWSGNIDDAEYLYCAAFNKRHPSIFGAGSTGANSSVRLYKQQQHDQHKHDLAAEISGLNQGCFSLDFSSKIQQFSFSTPHHGLYIFQSVKKG